MTCIKGRDQRGFAMAALLVGIAIMAVVMGAALPVWNTQVRREREEELVFRGQQYARAVMLFQKKTGAYPPNLDILVNEHFLRKKYKDPITNGEFQLVAVGDGIAQQAAAGRGAGGVPGAPPPPGGQQGGGVGTSTPTFGTGARVGGRPGGNPQTLNPGGRAGFGVPGAQGPGLGGAGGAGILGVVSKSTAQSLRLYNGRDKYNEWVFVATQATRQITAPPGSGNPGLPGNRGGGRGPGAPPGFPGAGRGPGTPTQPGTSPIGMPNPFGRGNPR